MNVVLVVAEGASLRETVRSAIPETDLVLFESAVEGALRQLIALRVDVIVVDDAHGIEGVERIHAASPNTASVALSGRDDAETVASRALAGARAYIAKPVRRADLIRMLSQIASQVGPAEMTAPESNSVVC